jgi:hypothetical protein
MMRDSIRNRCGRSVFVAISGAILGLGGLLSGGCSIEPVVYQGRLVYTQYEPLEDLEVDAFVLHAFAVAEEVYGPAVTPVNEVLLRRSRPLPAFRSVWCDRDFSETLLHDEKAGVYLIYMANEPRDKRFYPLLGHECFHLLNVHLRDWYVEGMATVFSEELCRALGIPWQERQVIPKIAGGGNVPYRASYRMMRELRAVLSHSDYVRLLSYAVASDAGEGLQRIDVDRWLATLSEADRDSARGIIATYSKVLRRTWSGRMDYRFAVPSER